MMSKQHKEERSEKLAYWKPHIVAWQQSGKSVRAYCKTHQLIASRFKYWQYQIAPASKRTKAALKPDFVELRPSNLHHQLDATEMMTIKTAEGLSITVGVSLSRFALSNLLAALRGISC